MRKLLLTVIVFCFSVSASASYKIERVEPAFWWVGMQNANLQLMVHGNDVADLSPELTYPGVAITRVHRTSNTNYLFVDLSVAKDTQPGSIPLRFTRDGEPVLSLNYRLLQRDDDSATRQGFGPEDVIYLITPDRFANGDPSNDSVASLSEGVNRDSNTGRHGGDIQGIINHLDYIADMGFTQIWLNPVRENSQPKYSYHGYAITDFYQVDARFGSNAQYQQLAQQAKARGIGLIMDMVLNHSGSNHWWMEDLPAEDWVNNNGKFTPTTHKREALHDPHAVEADREAFSSGWFVPTMPDLNQRNPLLATYLIQNSIWWVEFAGLSGIRVDTYSYSDKEFLTRWTQRLMEEYPNLNIVGEEWTLNPSIVAYWQHGTDTHDGYKSYLPSVMDFPLQNAVVQGLTEEDGWSTGLVKLYDMLAADFVYGDPYNLVVFPDNHDMDRIFTSLGEDEALWRMAMSYFLTTRGIPQVFYGTEILMSNRGAAGDHGAIREDFPGGWSDDKVNAFTGEGLSEKQKNAQDFMRRLLTWRKSSAAIAQGKLTHFAPENGVYVYFRHHEDDKVMVVMNKNDSAVTIDTQRFAPVLKSAAVGTDVLSGDRYNLKHHLEMKPRRALILAID